MRFNRCFYTCIILLISLTWSLEVYSKGNVEDILVFSDNADPSFLSEMESKLLKERFKGIAIRSPEYVWTSDTGNLPLIMAVGQSGDRDWKIRLPYNCILTATNLNTGKVLLSKAFVDEKRREPSPSDRGPKPPGLALRMVQVVSVNARQNGMSWDTGKWMLGVINYDWSSISSPVTLYGASEPPPAPGYDVFPTPATSKKYGFGLPSYLPSTDTPACPDNGLHFTSKFNSSNGAAALNIYGSFALPVMDYHLLTPKGIHQYKDGSKKTIAAIIPVTMVVIKLDQDLPIRFDWAVPVYGETLTSGMTARGYFSINALKASNTKLSYGRYLCYILIDGQIFGPSVFKVPDGVNK